MSVRWLCAVDVCCVLRVATAQAAVRLDGMGMIRHAPDRDTIVD